MGRDFFGAGRRAAPFSVRVWKRAGRARMVALELTTTGLADAAREAARVARDIVSELPHARGAREVAALLLRPDRKQHVGMLLLLLAVLLLLLFSD